MFCWGTASKPDDPVFTRDVDAFERFYCKVHWELGSRLSLVTVDEEGIVDFSGCCYRPIKDPDNEGKFLVQHNSGITAQALVSL